MHTFKISNTKNNIKIIPPKKQLSQTSFGDFQTHCNVFITIIFPSNKYKFLLQQRLKRLTRISENTLSKSVCGSNKCPGDRTEKYSRRDRCRAATNVHWQHPTEQLKCQALLLLRLSLKVSSSSRLLLAFYVTSTQVKTQLKLYIHTHRISRWYWSCGQQVDLR